MVSDSFVLFRTKAFEWADLSEKGAIPFSDIPFEVGQGGLFPLLGIRRPHYSTHSG